jgi:hypothetical protein
MVVNAYGFMTPGWRFIYGREVTWEGAIGLALTLADLNRTLKIPSSIPEYAPLFGRVYRKTYLQPYFAQKMRDVHDEHTADLSSGRTVHRYEKKSIDTFEIVAEIF